MSYFEAKAAAVRGEPYYDYRVGPGYEEIPVSTIYSGFERAFDDRRCEDADEDPLRHKNLPQFREALSVHTNDGMGHVGFYAMPDSVVLHDMAPDFVKSRIPGFGQIARCIAAERMLPLEDRLNTDKAVSETYAKPIFRGNALGLLFEEPFLGEPARGAKYGVRLE